MQYTNYYHSPIGDITLSADEAGLTGLWFDGQKYCGLYIHDDHEDREHHIFDLAKEWLDIYFFGHQPDFDIPLHFTGTDFQNEVWGILCNIAYGETVTYGEIAEILAARHGTGRMSAQAVGGAVGHNKIAVIVPCHRVVGANGSLTGYAGGIDKKIKLLKLENGFKQSFFVPKRSTAL